MKRWRLGLCLVLIAAMLAGDVSLLNVRAENTGLSVSGNDVNADVSDGAAGGDFAKQDPAV